MEVSRKEGVFYEQSKPGGSDDLRRVLSTAGISCHQAGRPAMPDSRPMIYFQGMKVYIPDGFQPETLLKLLQVMKQL